MPQVRVYGGFIRVHNCNCDFCEGGFVGQYVDAVVEAASGERAVKLVEKDLDGFVRWVPGQPVIIQPQFTVRMDWG